MTPTVTASAHADVRRLAVPRLEANFWIATACAILLVAAVAMAASAYVNGPVFEAPLIGP